MKKTDDVYIVEKLIDKKKKKGQVYYLVKWKNWSDSDNTWEPEDNILDKNLITEFSKKNKRHSRNDLSELDSSFQSFETDEGIPNPVSPLRLTETAITHETDAVAPHSAGSSTVAQISVCSTSSPSSIHNIQHGPSITTSNIVEHSVTEQMDWHFGRQFRKSTLMVAAASHSVAMQQSKQTKTHGESCAKSLPALSPRSPPQPPAAPVSDTIVQDSREKIRLVIPRDRLKACPPPGVPSSASASHNSSLIQQTPDTSFENNEPYIAPVEIARRLSEDFEVPVIPLKEPSLDIVSLNTNEVVSSSICDRRVSRKESSERKRRRKTEKSHRHKKHDGRKKRRRRSGSAASCISTASSLSDICLPPPRLAPLRIQLPKAIQSGSERHSDLDHDSWMYKYSMENSNTFFSPSIDRLKNLQNVSITDITIGDLTISIKESNDPKDFFGIASTQEVKIKKESDLQPEIPHQAVLKEVDEAPMSSSDKENDFGQSEQAVDKSILSGSLSTIAEEHSLNRSNDKSVDEASSPKRFCNRTPSPKFHSSTPSAPSPQIFPHLEDRPKSADDPSHKATYKKAMEQSVPSMVPFQRSSNFVKSPTPHLSPMRKIVSMTNPSHRPASLAKLNNQHKKTKQRKSKKGLKHAEKFLEVEKSPNVYTFPDETPTPTTSDVYLSQSQTNSSAMSIPSQMPANVVGVPTTQDSSTLAYLQYLDLMTKFNGSSAPPVPTTINPEQYRILGHINQAPFTFINPPVTISTTPSLPQLRDECSAVDDLPIDLSAKR